MLVEFWEVYHLKVIVFPKSIKKITRHTMNCFSVIFKVCEFDVCYWMSSNFGSSINCLSRIEATIELITFVFYHTIARIKHKNSLTILSLIETENEFEPIKCIYDNFKLVQIEKPDNKATGEQNWYNIIAAWYISGNSSLLI